MAKTLQIGLGVIFAVLAAWFLAPISAGIWNFGNSTGFMVSLAFFGLIVFIKPVVNLLHSHWWAKIIAIVISVITLICILFAVMVSVLMIAAAEKNPSQPVTLVVLGCKVEGTTPSMMLRRRIEAAYEYLDDHPDVACIASGGQGSNEDISEAQAIRDYLIQKGISEDRIYMEDQSTSTEENLLFSKEIIDQNGLPEEIAIASDYFHQFRASVIAGKLGLFTSSVPSHTPVWLLPTYWVREWIGMIQEWFLKS